MLQVVSVKRLKFTTSRLVQLVPVAPLESPLSRLEQVVSIGQPSLLSIMMWIKFKSVTSFTQ